MNGNGLRSPEYPTHHPQAAVSFAREIVDSLIRVPGRACWLGSDPAKDPMAFAREQPQFRAQVATFYIAPTPSTNAHYRPFVAEMGVPAPLGWQGGEPPAGKEHHPVVGMTWAEVEAYIAWLAQLSGVPLRLPSEFEWEKAARGTEAMIFPWGNQAPSHRYCNFAMQVGDTSPAGSFPAGRSPYGCDDMAGNVWEWTASSLQRYANVDAVGSAEGQVTGHRVLRGGSFLDGAAFVRCAFRLSHSTLSRRRRTVGFRLASSTR